MIPVKSPSPLVLASVPEFIVGASQTHGITNAERPLVIRMETSRQREDNFVEDVVIHRYAESEAFIGN